MFTSTPPFSLVVWLLFHRPLIHANWLQTTTTQAHRNLLPLTPSGHLVTNTGQSLPSLSLSCSSMPFSSITSERSVGPNDIHSGSGSSFSKGCDGKCKHMRRRRRRLKAPYLMHVINDLFRGVTREHTQLQVHCVRACTPVSLCLSTWASKHTNTYNIAR